MLKFLLVFLGTFFVTSGVSAHSRPNFKRLLGLDGNAFTLVDLERFITRHGIKFIFNPEMAHKQFYSYASIVKVTTPVEYINSHMESHICYESEYLKSPLKFDHLGEFDLRVGEQSEDIYTFHFFVPVEEVFKRIQHEQGYVYADDLYYAQFVGHLLEKDLSSIRNPQLFHGKLAPESLNFFLQFKTHISLFSSEPSNHASSRADPSIS